MTEPEKTTPAFKPPPAGQPGMRFGSYGMPTERSKDFGNTTRRLLRRLRRERWLVFVAILMTVCSVAMSVSLPKILGNATDVIVNAIFTRSAVNFDHLGRLLGLAASLLVGAWALQYGMSYLLAGVVQRTMYHLRADVEDKLNRLPLSYIDRAERGDLLSRVTNDIDNIAQSLQQTLSQMLTQALTLVGTVAMMIWISWLLALVALVTIPLSMFMMRAIASRSRKRFIAQWMHTGKLNAQVEETFTGHAIVKAFGRQREVERSFRATNDDLYEASFGAQFVSGVIQPATMMMGNLNFVAIAVLGGVRVANGAMTIGGIQAFIQYSRSFTQPLSWIASMVNLFQSGIASAERVFEFLDADEQTADAAEYQPMSQCRGRVEFSHVSFSYDPKTPLIADLSLVAEPGRTVAIVGHTGAGKTTLVNLIMRFYELDAGQITIDGRDIARNAAPGVAFTDRYGAAGHMAVRRDDSREHRVWEPRRDRGADPGSGARHLRGSLRSLAAGWLRHEDRRRGQLGERRRTAADHDRTRIPGGPADPDPRRSDQLRGHPDRSAHSARNGGAALTTHELRHRSPPVHDPRRRYDSRDGRRPDR